jgi:hypothetical protein
MADKKLIKIINTPEGPGIPEEIRKGWIGSVFEAEGPDNVTVRSVLNTNETYGLHLVYTIPSELALTVLKYRNKKAWEWFNKQPNMTRIFAFNADCCREI